MIAIVIRKRGPLNPRLHCRFMEMLPVIRRHACVSFRHIPAELREELVQETIANCFVAFWRLHLRRKLSVAFPSALARFAVAQVRVGRRVGDRLNGQDVSSSYAQRKKKFRVETLDRYDHDGNEWRVGLIADRRTPVDEQAAFRIDFPEWLARLAPRQRRIAEYLAAGNPTGQTARHFRISAGRISQLRLELYCNWLRFNGDPSPPEAAT